MGRLGGILTVFILTPLLLGYLGPERYGLVVTIGSVTAWLSLFQLGVAPSLINWLAPMGRDGDPIERATIISSAWGTSLLLSVLVLIPLVPAMVFVPWASVFNIAPGPTVDEARLAVAIVWVGVAASIPLGNAAAIFRADQEGHVPLLWGLAGSALAVAAGVAAVLLDGGIAGVVAATTGTSVAIGCLITAHVFFRRSANGIVQLKAFNADVARKLLKTGVGFTGISLASLIITVTDPIVITQVLGPANVPPYSVPFSLLLIFFSFELVVLDAAWPGYSEAAARRDRSWLERAHGRVTALLMAASICFALGLVLFGGAFIRLWAGDAAVPPPTLLWVLGLLAIVQCFLFAHGRLLVALGKVRQNTILALANAAINLPLSIFLATILGVTGVALGTLAGYLVIGFFMVRQARAALGAVGTDGNVALSSDRAEASQTQYVPPLP